MASTLVSKSTTSGEVNLTEGIRCEFLSAVTAREQEASDSAVVTELECGTVVTLVRMGDLPQRALVTFGGLEAWVNVKTEVGSPLTAPRTPMLTILVGKRSESTNIGKNITSTCRKDAKNVSTETVPCGAVHVDTHILGGPETQRRRDAEVLRPRDAETQRRRGAET